MANSEETNPLHSILGRALIFCLLPGPLLFILDQAMTWHSMRLPLSPGIFIVYTALFFLMGLIGVGLSTLLVRRRGLDRAWRVTAVVAGAYPFALLGIQIHRAFSRAPGWKGIAVLCLALAILAVGWLRPRAKIKAGLFDAAQSLGLIALVEAWALFPHRIGSLGRLWPDLIAGALFMTLILGLLFQIRLRQPWGVRLDAGALIGVLVLSGAAYGSANLVAAHELDPSPAVASAPARPNIIFIVWDTVRRDHLSVYGYDRPTTPYLEQLARESMVYTNAVSVAAWTLPAHASMMTGLYPREHGSYNNTPPPGGDLSKWSFDSPPLNGKFTTLAEILARHGYRCGAVSANTIYVSRSVGLGRGFEYFYDHPSATSLLSCHFDLALYLADLLKYRAPESLLYRYFNYYPAADQVNNIALRWVDSVRKGGQSFFLFLNYMDAHGPVYGSDNLIHLFPGFKRDLLFQRCETTRFQAEKSTESLEAWSNHLISQYDAEIRILDKQLKELVEQLKERGLLDRTIIILTSDHGDHLGDHGGIIGHRFDTYSELSDIPLIIRYTGGSPRGIEPDMIENRSLFFLVQQMAGIEAEVPKEPWEASDEAYGENPGFAPTQKMNPNVLVYHRAFFFGHYKLIVSNLDPPELYDLARDPHETANLASQEPEVYEQGLELSSRFLHEVPEFKAANRAPTKFSAEQRQRMKALGYLK